MSKDVNVGETIVSRSVIQSIHSPLSHVWECDALMPSVWGRTQTKKRNRRIHKTWILVLWCKERVGEKWVKTRTQGVKRRSVVLVWRYGSCMGCTDMTHWRYQHIFGDHVVGTHSLVFSSDGRLLVSGCGNVLVFLWDPTNWWSPLWSQEDHINQVKTPPIGVGGEVIVFSGQSGLQKNIALIDMITHHVYTIKLWGDLTVRVCFHRTGICVWILDSSLRTRHQTDFFCP
jgi:hypothetical protein